MAEWPGLEELKQVLDVTASEDEASPWDGDEDNTRLTRLLGSAIDQVKLDIGAWIEYEDEPTDSQAQAALRLAEILALKPQMTAAEIAGDGIYLRLMKGQRVRFGGFD